MDRQKLDAFCEKGILGLVLSILVFGVLATGAVRAMEFLVIQWLTMGAVLLWGIRLWINPRALLMWPPICWVVLAFLGYTIGLYFFAEVEYAARKELTRVVVYTFVFLLVINNLHRQEFTQLATLTLIFVGMAISAYAIYQFATDSPHVWHFLKPKGYMKRAGGTFINPNHLAGFLELVFPISLAYVLLGRFSHALKAVLVYACVVMLAGIAVTISRAGVAVTGTVLVIFLVSLIFSKGSSRLLRVSAGGMLLVLLIGGAAFVSKTQILQKRLDPLLKTDVNVRGYFWKSAIQVWKDHFWFGAGPGHFDFNYARHKEPVWQAQGRPVFVHNDYLNTLADWGTIGLFLIIVTLGLLVFGIWRTWAYVKRNPNDIERKGSNRFAFVFGASMGLLALLLHAVVEFNMQIPAIALAVVTIMALVSSYQRFATERFWITPSAVVKVLLTIFFIAGISWLGIASIRTFREYFWLARAKKATSVDQRIAAWEKAYAVEPNNSETAFNIGEARRLQSWEGNDGYEKLAEEAVQWFQRAIKANPLDYYPPLRCGMSLDWLGRKKEAGPYFEKAVSIDPNGYYTVAHMGWHYFQLDEFETAKTWFERSLKIYGNHMNRSHMAVTYIELCKQRIAEQAQNQSEKK